MRQRQQVAVGGAIFNSQSEVLLVRRIANDEFMPGVWEFPGGGTDFGEKPDEGLRREVKEECGLAIKVGQPIMVADYYLERNNEKVQRVEIIFNCLLVGDHTKVVLSNEHDQFVWKKLNDLGDLKMTAFMQKIIDAVRNFVAGRSSIV